MKKKFNLHNISALRVALFTGCILLLLIGGILAVIFIGGGGRSFGRESAFHRMLREYDFKYSQVLEEASGAVRRQGVERLDSDLDRLEKRAGGVESWLSVLKRRRQLAGLDYNYEQPYRQSSRRAAGIFPHSEPIAAVAAAALVRHAAVTPEGEEYLRSALPLLASPRSAPLRLNLHVLLGDFKSPEKAAASLPRGFMAPDLSVSGLDTEAILADLILLKIITGDIPSAAVDIQSAIREPQGADAPESKPVEMPRAGLVRLAAEYFYDFGDLVRSAELFSTLPDEDALGRQADALWLAGYTDNARTIWAMQEETFARALYNLALTAPTVEEETALLQRLVTQGADGGDIRRFGLIRFSRFLEAPHAVAVLETEGGVADPLIDLEKLKRQTEFGELARMFAETWLLLDRYPETADMYHWGSWYFNLQRNFPESAKLLQIAARHNFTGLWVDIYGALQCIHDGNFDAAEDMLAGIAGGNWAAAANMGRILESRRAPAPALEQYERALAVVMAAGDTAAASRIQVRVALCLKTLGRAEECRRALGYALDLNPDNLTARLELSRL